MKRAIDLILAVSGLLIVTPVMLIITLLLWIESPGNVIFSQKRLGQYGKRFAMYKFRKFPADWGNQGPGVTVTNDARMTTIGAVLERLKFDELPQLWNIIKGDMSVVGPRPETLGFADLYVGRYGAVLNNRPGLFGPSVILNEGGLYPPDEDPEEYYRRVLFPQKAERDLAYYQSATLVSDFLWIVKGLWVSIVRPTEWSGFLRSHGSVILSDILFIQIGWTLVNFFRYSVYPQGPAFVAGLWIFPLFFVACALAGRCYRYPRRYFSLADGIRLMVAFSIAWMSGFLALVEISRSVSMYLVPMGWFVVFSLLTFARIGFCIAPPRSSSLSRSKRNAVKVLLYGPDEGGVALADWIKSAAMGVKVVGFMGDTPENGSQRVHGVPVLGGVRDLSTIQSVHTIDEIWLTFRPDRKKRHRLNTFCQKHDVKLVVFPELEPFKRLALHRA